MNETRYRRLKSTGAMLLCTVCCVCGAKDVPYGYDVFPPQLGKWYCAKHRPEVYGQPELFSPPSAVSVEKGK